MNVRNDKIAILGQFYGFHTDEFKQRLEQMDRIIFVDLGQVDKVDGKWAMTIDSGEALEFIGR